MAIRAPDGANKQCTHRVKRGGENKQSDSLAVKGGINWDIAASFLVCET